MFRSISIYLIMIYLNFGLTKQRSSPTVRIFAFQAIDTSSTPRLMQLNINTTIFLDLNIFVVSVLF